MAEVKLTMDEFLSLQNMATSGGGGDCANCPHANSSAVTPASKPKRKASSSNKRYAAAFKKVKGRFMKKNGGWKKNGFRNAARAAHKLAKK